LGLDHKYLPWVVAHRQRHELVLSDAVSLVRRWALNVPPIILAAVAVCVARAAAGVYRHSSHASDQGAHANAAVPGTTTSIAPVILSTTAAAMTPAATAASTSVQAHRVRIGLQVSY